MTGDIRLINNIDFHLLTINVFKPKPIAVGISTVRVLNKPETKKKNKKTVHLHNTLTLPS